MSKYNITYVCSKCNKDFDEGQHPGYFIVFNKCRGKTCPDCGKVRKLGRIKCLYENLSRPGSEGKNFFECSRCNKMTEYFFNGICPKCFCEVQKEKNSCVCPFIKVEQGKLYHCSFCEEFHSPFHWVRCKECAKKQDDVQSVNSQKKKEFYEVLLNVLIGVIIGIGVGFFLGWLFFNKLRKMR